MYEQLSICPQLGAEPAKQQPRSIDVLENIGHPREIEDAIRNRIEPRVHVQQDRAKTECATKLDVLRHIVNPKRPLAEMDKAMAEGATHVEHACAAKRPVAHRHLQPLRQATEPLPDHCFGSLSPKRARRANPGLNLLQRVGGFRGKHDHKNKPQNLLSLPSPARSVPRRGLS